METTFKTINYPGFTEKQAKEKLLSEGYNELPSSKPKNILHIALGVVKEPMFMLLGSLRYIVSDTG